MKTLERATITIPLHEYNKLVNEHADLKAKLSQVEARWTNSPPTVPGWYWCKGPWSRAFIRFVGENVIVDEPDSLVGLIWSGPIPEPQEPPSATPK